MTPLSTSLTTFYKRLENIYSLQGTKALLDWDQQVCMPPRGAEARGQQLEYLSVLLHQHTTDESLYECVAHILDASASEIEMRPEDTINARWFKKLSDRQKKLPESFVAEQARLNSDTFNLWQVAKPQGDFDSVSGYLEKIVSLARKEAELVGYGAHPYDALLDQYEPGATVAWIKPLLLPLADSLKPLIQNRSEKSPAKKFPLELSKQKVICEEIMVKFGLPREGSRLDLSSHPFCTTIGTGDVRITTRLKEEDLLYGLGSVLHELGHALYEFNLPEEFRGSACGSVYSLGMHESQSRFIENMVGRSREFSEYLYDLYCQHADPAIASRLGAEDIYFAQNQITPSLIRVDADEVTYSLHVIIRMVLEIDLIEGSLSVKDLPARWNQLYEEYLGVHPDSHTQGVLQDVHWYSGSIGYFPTYVLGNIYGGIMLDKLRQEPPQWESQISKGEFNEISQWLKENVHLHGARYAPGEFMERLGGGTITFQPFIDYLKKKHL